MQERPKAINSLISFAIASSLCKDLYPNVWVRGADKLLPTYDLKLGGWTSQIAQYVSGFAVSVAVKLTEVTWDGVKSSVVGAW